jgi:hypothetical protein
MQERHVIHEVIVMMVSLNVQLILLYVLQIDYEHVNLCLEKDVLTHVRITFVETDLHMPLVWIDCFEMLMMRNVMMQTKIYEMDVQPIVK